LEHTASAAKVCASITTMSCGEAEAGQACNL
jgi:hypothetical protein